MSSVIGIDPGLSGALALIGPDGLNVVDMPTIEGRVDAYALTALLAEAGPVDRVAIERAQAYPGMGVSSAFNYGLSYGLILGVLAALERPVVHVAPSVWTKALHVGADKDAHRRRCMDRWPAHAQTWARKKDDGRADAALIALWAMMATGERVA